MQIGPGTVIDRYTVEALLGEGGMAVVYKVRHNTLGSLHALKVLTITSPELKRRLVQEGRVQGQLRHPNIVAVTDVVEVGDAPALVMEFIEGPTLDDYIAAQRPTIEQADALAQGILDGVAAAHAKGLIHRDLKPGNILLQVSPSGLTPKITDFGLAKVRGNEPGGWTRTREGTAMGTPHYMSPEQIRDATAVAEPGDVFALGAILYELVSGVRAFDGPDVLEIFNAVAHAKYKPLREVCPAAPERMNRAISGALTERIEERVQSVSDLRAVWNGERLGPWDPKTLGDVVAMIPPEHRAKTKFSMAPFTRYTAGTLMGGGVLLAGLVLGGIGVASLVAVAIGLYGISPSSPTPVEGPAPLTDGAAVAEVHSEPEVSAEGLPFVGPLPGEPATPAPEGAVAVDPSSEAEPAAAPAPRAANPWEAAEPAASGSSGLTGATPAERLAELEALADDAGATWAIGDAMKNDADPAVRKKAFKLLVERWEGQVGPAGETGLLVGWMARNGAADQRVEACEAIGRRGTALSDLAVAVKHSAPNVRRAAIDALGLVAARTGQQAAARAILQEQLPKETDGRTEKRLVDVLKELG